MSTLPVQLQQPKLDHNSPGFQKGHPRYGGRKKSSRNKFGGNLREAVVAGIQAVGFMEKSRRTT
jgi:hypothetical protein